MTTPRDQEYQDMIPLLERLYTDLVKQSEDLRKRSDRLFFDAEEQAIAPNQELMNRLYQQAEGLTYQASVVDSTIAICRGRGTAAELVTCPIWAGWPRTAVGVSP